MGEKICSDFSKSESCDFAICCGRIFSFYHETQAATFLYPKIMKRLQEEDLSKPFFVYNADGIRDFLNAEKVVDIIIKLMEKKVSETVNIASGKPIKIRDFVQQFSDVKLQIITDENPPESLIPNIKKLQSLLK
jgi:UDP-glucose 4-epimerase/GDP-4-dehydro-6-deoxy-D-mannose reductase